MTTRMMIECDHCKKQEQVTGTPLPNGWGRISVITWDSQPGYVAPIRHQQEYDLCPEHFPDLKKLLNY